MYTFHELFAHYAKHLERYFSTVDPSEKDLYPSAFHNVLMKGIDIIAQERYHSPSSSHILNGHQLERMSFPLKTAEQECDAEHSLQHILCRFNFPVSIYSPQPGDYPSEYEIFKRCCPLESVDEE